jgi:hypothetical protein
LPPNSTFFAQYIVYQVWQRHEGQPHRVERFQIANACQWNGDHCPASTNGAMITTVITLRELTIGLTAGGLLLLFAFVPGLFQRLAEEVRNSIDSVSSPYARHSSRYEPIQTPRFALAVSGVALILVSIISYI